jgi:ribosome maturation factor RimP
MEKQAKLKELIERELSDYLENAGLFLVDVNVLLNNKIEIFADGKTNITIDQCAAISRHIENYLESNGYVGDKYTLEVSSPGMDQPLKVTSQFEKQKGKMVDVVLKNGNKITGTLSDFNEEKITITELVKQKDKTEAEVQHILSFLEIKSVKKHFNFKL